MSQEACGEVSLPPTTTRRKSNGASSGNVIYTRRVNEQTYSFDGWQITILKSPILPSNCYCNNLDASNTKGLLLELGCKFEDLKLPVVDNLTSNVKCHVCRYADALPLKHFPDMVFPDNYLHLHHESSGLILQFNTLDAMKLISTQDTESIRVECSEAWQAAKTEMGLPNEVLHDYNWTFATEYHGTLKSARNGDNAIVVNDPEEQLNMEKLKQRENILFYDEITLFEDELHDSGISNLNVKMRVMPSGFFILLRHALRVDHVMAKICDTRIYYEAGNKYFLRQTQIKQASFKNLGEVDPHKFSDMNSLSDCLPVTKEETEKIMLE